MSDLPTQHPIVLIVDDTPETLGFLTTALEQADYTVLVAIDGETALALLDEISPDLVLMDAVMTGLDGFETCRRLKQCERSATIPVIFMTGLSDTSHVINGFEAGGIDYVVKPVIIEQLLVRMRTHIGAARRAQGTRAALDAAGRALVAIDDTGCILWATHQGRHLLGNATHLPMLDRADTRPQTAHLATRDLQFNQLGRTGPQEWLFRLVETGTAPKEHILRQRFKLTAREAEVLVWVAAGKPNRDVSDILGISPRTVNKHLEQVFLKLGVENRAAATNLAMRATES